MITIGVIGAMELEIASLKESLEIISKREIIGVEFLHGKMFSKSVIIATSRMGLVNAAICSQILIDMFGVDYIINIGFGGAIKEELDFGDVIIAKDLVQYDFDLTAYGKPLGVNPNLPSSVFLADENLVKLAYESSLEILTDKKTYIDTIASGDTFITEEETKKTIGKRLSAASIDMESSAIAQTCFLNKIPFVIIRTITDKASKEAKKEFLANNKNTIDRLTAITLETIKKI